MFTITKEFHFSASHVLTGLRKDHPCSRMHGHNYIIKVEMSSVTLDGTSFVVDYGKLDPIKKFIDSNFDHKFIAISHEQVQKHNLKAEEYIILGRQSSAENLAQFIYNQFSTQFPTLTGIGVSETPKTWAWYRPSKVLDVVVNEPIARGVIVDYEDVEITVLKDILRNISPLQNYDYHAKITEELNKKFKQR